MQRQRNKPTTATTMNEVKPQSVTSLGLIDKNIELGLVSNIASDDQEMLAEGEVEGRNQDNDNHDDESVEQMAGIERNINQSGKSSVMTRGMRAKQQKDKGAN